MADLGAESRVSMSELTAIIHELDQVDERHGAMNGGGSGPPLGRARLPGVQDAGERGETADSEVQQSSTVPLFDFPYSQHAQDRPTVSQTLRRLLPRLDVLVTRTTAYPGLVRALEMHASRLDALENASISNAPFEDVWDRIDLMDGRVTHVEVRAEDLENWRAACDEEEQSLENALGHRRCGDAACDRLGRDGSFLSTGSGCTHTSKSHSTALVAATHDLAEVRSRLAAVEARLDDVEQTLPPSAESPWLVEVVMLPWGRDLRGIWFLADNAADTTSGTAEWTQSRDVAGGSRTNSFHQDGDDGAVWTGRSIAQWAQDADLWKSARACGTRSRVYRRLKSRGLVRDVHVTGGSAKDLEDAVLDAFGGTLEAISGDPGVWADGRSPSRDSGHVPGDCGALGLRSPYVPLRKIHRDSRLRFLSPAEMVTSAMWNAEFLESSVVMKPRNGPHRLFVTHRDGYLQDSQRDRADWTWPKLKQLPTSVAQRRRPDGHATNAAGADAREPCWEWDPRLDASTSTRSSFTHDAPSRSAAVGSSGPAGARHVPERASQPSAARLRSASPVPAAPILPVSPLSNRVSQPKRRRDASRLGPRMSMQSDARPVSQPQRSAARHEASLSSSTRPTAKKLRISRSPTYESSAPAFVWAATPRRSAPPSPFFSEIAAGDGRSQATATSNAKTGGTQFAYATPHSGPVIDEGREHYNRPSGIGGGVNSSEGIGASHTNDHPDHDVWEGVGDVPASAEQNGVEDDAFDDTFQYSGDEASHDENPSASQDEDDDESECEQDDEDDNGDDSDDDDDDDDDDSAPSV